MKLWKNYYPRIKPTKIPDFLIVWMFVISKEYKIISSNWIMQSNQLYTIKIEVCTTLLIQKNVKENKKSKILKDN